MSYTVLARRYRSQSFDQVVGQETIARTLRNAIACGRVAHAYLFSGTRGVGKTSMARIFARALNAPDTIADAPKPDDGDWPALEVQQRMADAIMRGDDLNVIEIDGASNNSVDQARQLIANASLSPTGNARYKIYIIDEVHMLSPSAFNALLKTMEEPPGHVKFILCTTEAHKVPATIQSRCQCFDFRNIPTANIKKHLGNVVAQENLAADDAVLFHLAQLGNGSMRDALSLLDRLIATGAQSLDMQLLDQMLGLAPQQLIVALLDAMADGDVKAVLENAAAILAGGISQDQLFEALIERLRQLMLIGACGANSELVELPDSAREQAEAQAKRFDAPALTYMIALCENVQRNSKVSATPRALLDATLVRLALAEKMADVAALLQGGGAMTSEKKKLTAKTPTPAVANSVPTQLNAPAPASPIAQVDVNDPADVWDALHQRLADQRAWGWIDNVALLQIDKQAGVVAPKPGHGEMMGFLTQPRLDQIAGQLEPILGHKVRITLQQAGDTSAGQNHQPTPNGNGAAAGFDRRQAMDLPLVKKVLDAFPDATILNVLPDEPQT